MDRNNFYNTKEVAEILGVSTATIRRWCDNDEIKCFRVGTSQYRKFDKAYILSLKEKFYGKNDNNNLSEDATNTVISESIKADPHPAHYLMHKYWGRKPHNVVSYYISHYTKKGETVLEPFMGSGVTVIEALKLKRNVIGIDLNPMSKFIVENSISKVDVDELEKEYRRIEKNLRDNYSQFYITKCPCCGKNSSFVTGVWENDKLVRIRGNCTDHGLFQKDATDFDIDLYKQCSLIRKENDSKLNYPRQDILQYVKRSGRTRIDELFTDRALIILSDLKNQIESVQDKTIRNTLLFCFTSMLSNVSRMLPGDKEKATYKSGWVISKFWTPKIHTERNIFGCLELRYKAIIKGKEEIKDLDSSLANIYTADSSHLNFIKDESIDYIFTDPPYGESIAYFALSQFWNSWISDSVDYENEIIIDPYRNKDYDDFAKRTADVYKELYRVLKKNKYLSFTFNNRDLNVWKAVLDACNSVGFSLESIVLQEQAVSSGTQGINRKNTLTGDFVYNFKKTGKVKSQNKQVANNVEEFIVTSIEKLIIEKNGVTPTELYEYLIPLIVKNNAYKDENDKALDLEKIMEEHFDYIEVSGDSKLGSKYKWIKK